MLPGLFSFRHESGLQTPPTKRGSDNSMALIPAKIALASQHIQCYNNRHESGLQTPPTKRGSDNSMALISAKIALASQHIQCYNNRHESGLQTPPTKRGSDNSMALGMLLSLFDIFSELRYNANYQSITGGNHGSFCSSVSENHNDDLKEELQERISLKYLRKP